MREQASFSYTRHVCMVFFIYALTKFSHGVFPWETHDDFPWAIPHGKPKDKLDPMYTWENFPWDISHGFTWGFTHALHGVFPLYPWVFTHAPHGVFPLYPWSFTHAPHGVFYHIPWGFTHAPQAPWCFLTNTAHGVLFEPP